MLFFELLQVAIGNRKELSHTPSEGEWLELYVLAQQQTLVGIAFRGVEQLPGNQRPPKSLLMQWYMATERIKAMNADLDRKALAVANKFLEEGFPGVVLKGQGISKLYKGPLPNPLPRRGDFSISKRETEEKQSPFKGMKKNETEQREDDIVNESKDNLSFVIFNFSSYRTPGDIDIWLRGGREEVLRYVRKHVPDCKPVYHHVDFPVIDGLDIEVHFTPSWMNSPVTNRRLQRFFKAKGEWLKLKGGEYTQDGTPRHRYSEIPSPCIDFNRVYILVHIYRHLFHEGIGLRQLMDYYFVLRQGFTEEERMETMRTLRSLRMERFAAAVMWVLHEVFAMEERYMLIAPNEKEGRFLLSEIMLAGNFGHYDERLLHEQGESTLHWALRKVKRNFRFVRSYPSEVLWSPLFKLWHYVWRRRHNSAGNT